MTRWQRNGGFQPPPEAYGRLTNPERYTVLHSFADELLDRLERTYERRNAAFR